MPYTMEWKPAGAVKHFTGKVSFAELLRSEEEISGCPEFTSLRYVISDYSDAEYRGISPNQRAEINALRIGAHMVNPRIKYAFVIGDPLVQAQIREAVAEGFMLYETRVFDSLDEALRWVGA